MRIREYCDYLTTFTSNFCTPFSGIWKRCILPSNTNSIIYALHIHKLYRCNLMCWLWFSSWKQEETHTAEWALNSCILNDLVYNLAKFSGMFICEREPKCPHNFIPALCSPFVSPAWYLRRTVADNFME